MTVPYWILDRSQAPTVENGVARIQLTDGRESKTLVLRLDREATEFLEASAYADGSDALFEILIWYWASERRNSTPGWIPRNEVLGRDEIEKFHALSEVDRKAKTSSPYPFWS